MDGWNGWNGITQSTYPHLTQCDPRSLASHLNTRSETHPHRFHSPSTCSTCSMLLFHKSQLVSSSCALQQLVCVSLFVCLVVCLLVLLACFVCLFCGWFACLVGCLLGWLLVLFSYFAAGFVACFVCLFYLVACFVCLFCFTRLHVWFGLVALLLATLQWLWLGALLCCVLQILAKRRRAHSTNAGPPWTY